jgi:hypothetical protein
LSILPLSAEIGSVPYSLSSTHLSFPDAATDVYSRDSDSSCDEFIVRLSRAIHRRFSPSLAHPIVISLAQPGGAQPFSPPAEEISAKVESCIARLIHDRISGHGS